MILNPFEYSIPIGHKKIDIEPLPSHLPFDIKYDFYSLPLPI